MPIDSIHANPYPQGSSEGADGTGEMCRNAVCDGCCRRPLDARKSAKRTACRGQT